MMVDALLISSMPMIAESALVGPPQEFLAQGAGKVVAQQLYHAGTVRRTHNGQR